jgi:hypothetical protein
MITKKGILPEFHDYKKQNPIFQYRLMKTNWIAHSKWYHMADWTETSVNVCVKKQRTTKRMVRAVLETRFRCWNEKSACARLSFFLRLPCSHSSMTDFCVAHRALEIFEATVFFAPNMSSTHNFQRKPGKAASAWTNEIEPLTDYIQGSTIIYW